MRTPDYILTAPVSWYAGSAQDVRVLPIGAFVRPIWDTRYLPSHLRDPSAERIYALTDPADRFRYRDNDAFVHCYTRFGLVCIETKLLRAV